MNNQNKQKKILLKIFLILLMQLIIFILTSMEGNIFSNINRAAVANIAHQVNDEGGITLKVTLTTSGSVYPGTLNSEIFDYLYNNYLENNYIKLEIQDGVSNGGDLTINLNHNSYTDFKDNEIFFEEISVNVKRNVTIEKLCLEDSGNGNGSRIVFIDANEIVVNPASFELYGYRYSIYFSKIPVRTVLSDDELSMLPEEPEETAYKRIFYGDENEPDVIITPETGVSSLYKVSYYSSGGWVTPVSYEIWEKDNTFIGYTRDAYDLSLYKDGTTGGDTGGDTGGNSGSDTGGNTGGGVVYEDIELPVGTTQIPDNAYQYNTNLRSIVIPEGVTSIGEYAFAGCTNLTSITIPESVTYIGLAAFQNCTSLVEVNYLAKNCFIEWWREYSYAPFLNCPLTTINFGGKVTKIPQAMFYNPTKTFKFTEITIPTSIKYIEDYAFEFCNKLTTINIPENSSLTTIGKCAFDGCTNLTSITIPKSVISIGNSTFKNCNSLETVTMPEDSKLTTIGQYAFDRSGITSITIPKNVTSIGLLAFRNCTSLKKVQYNAKNCFVEYKANSNNPVFANAPINEVTFGSEVEVIPDTIFWNPFGTYTIETITIPNSVKRIGKYAFQSSEKIKTVTMGTGIEEIGFCAFEGCINLTSITIPEKTKKMEGHVFYDCKALKTVNYNAINCSNEWGSNYIFKYAPISTINIGNNVQVIPEALFYDNEGTFKVTSISIPSNVTTIGKNAFRKCSTVNILTIGKGVTEIGENAFSECTGLKKINYNAIDCDVKYIANCSQFADCPIEEFKFGEEVEVIPCALLWNSSNKFKIRNIEIPDSVIIIKDYAFENCITMETVNMGANVEEIGSLAFHGCTSLTSITIPEEVKTMGGLVFHECTSLAEVNYNAINCSNGWGSNYIFKFAPISTINIGNNVQVIPEALFYDNEGTFRVTSISIPSNVTTIGKNAFRKCKTLTNLNLGTGVKTIGEFAFAETGLVNLTIPANIDTIGVGAFACTTLESIEVETSNSNFASENGMLLNKAKTKIICYPGGKTDKYYLVPSYITEIESYAFYGANKLKSIGIPPNVTTIGNNAFIRTEQANLTIYYQEDSQGVIDYRENALNNLDYITFVQDDIIPYTTLFSATVGDPKVKISSNIDSMKEIYKDGEEVSISIYFNEEIYAAEMPNLQLKFGEEDAKGSLSYTVDGNLLEYTYVIAEGDNGQLSVRGIEGKVYDKAGNVFNSVPMQLYSNKIIADTINPNLTEIKVISPEATVPYKAGNVITIQAIYDKNIYSMKNQTLDIIKSGNQVPILGLKFGGKVAKGTVKFNKAEANIITYTYTITSGDNGVISFGSYTGDVYDIAGNPAVKEVNKLTGNLVEADTTNPYITNISAIVEDPIIKNTEIYYRENNVVKITIRFSENVYALDNEAKINVKFGNENAKGETTLVEIKDDMAIFNHVIEAGDTGNIKISMDSNQVQDIAGNKNDGKEFVEINKIYADTTLPKIELLENTNGIQNNQEITITAKFSEKIYNVANNTREGLTIQTAPKLMYRFGEGEIQTVTASSVTENSVIYKINKDPIKDDGTFSILVINGTVYDRAGNDYNIFAESTDTTAPILRKINIVSPVSGIYKAGTVVTFEAIYDEKVVENNTELTFTIGEKEKKISAKEISQNKVVYEYTITGEEEKGDNGEIIIKSIAGTVTDEKGNIRELFDTDTITVGGETVIADTTKPKLTIEKNFEGDTTNSYSVIYTFKWSEEINKESFTIDDITITNGKILNIENDENNNLSKIELLRILDGTQQIYVGESVCTDIAGNESAKYGVHKIIIKTDLPEVRYITDGGNYILPTNSNVATINSEILVTDAVSSLQYAWSNQKEIPQSGWIDLSTDDVGINSKILIKTTEATKGTWYLHIKAVDKSGNITNTVSNPFIVNEGKITLTLNNTEITNQDVIVSVNYGEFATQNRYAGVGNERNANIEKITVRENGVVYAEATDIAGNKIVSSIEILNIDKTLPVISGVEEGKEYNKKVIPTISDENLHSVELFKDDEKISEYKNGDSIIEAGQYTIIAKDVAGNITTINFKVINESEITVTETIYEINENKKIIRKISPETGINSFIEKLNVDGTLRIKDKDNKYVTTGNIKTGMKLELTTNEEITIYELIVTGDVNKDGSADFKDILQINKYRLNKIEFTEILKMAADANNDNTVNIKDIFLINKYRLGKIDNL